MLNLFKRSTVQANFLSLCPLEQFEFVSQRHRGYPFSATLYVNGIVVSRISSCCEYRYAPGFQQGRKSCFRLTWLAGGLPCYRLDFILCETDGVSLAENGKLVPVKTDLLHFNFSLFFFFFRCTSLRNKYSSCQQLDNSTKEGLILPLEQSPGNSTKPGSEHLFFPFLPEAYSSTFFDLRPRP